MRFRVDAGHAVPFEGHFARPVQHCQKHFIGIGAAGHAAEDSDLRNPFDQPVRFQPLKRAVQHTAVAFELIHQFSDRIELRAGGEVVKLPVQHPVQFFDLRFKFHTLFPKLCRLVNNYTGNAQLKQ